MGIENRVNPAFPAEFERPTPKQRTDELMDVAGMMGNPPVSVIFGEGGLASSIIGASPRFPQDPIIPDAQNGIDMLDQKDPEGKSGKRKKTQPPMKDNQARHAQNLSGLDGWHKGIFYTNGQPMRRKNNNTNGARKNGNGKH